MQIRIAAGSPFSDGDLPPPPPAAAQPDPSAAENGIRMTCAALTAIVRRDARTPLH
jgi:hypothetical protein